MNEHTFFSKDKGTNEGRYGVYINQDNRCIGKMETYQALLEKVIKNPNQKNYQKLQNYKGELIEACGQINLDSLKP